MNVILIISLFLIVGSLALIVIGAFSLKSGLFIKAVTRTDHPPLLFTFDDGPHPEYTPQILDVLKAYQVKACFFLIGSRAEQHPDLVRRIDAEGHKIGNHTWSHRVSDTFAGRKKYSEELRKTSELIASIIHQPVEWFRPPFGVTNPIIADAIKNQGLKVMGWSVRSFDTVTPDPNTIVARVIGQLSSNSIVLLHDTMPQTVEALPHLLQYCQEKHLI